MKYSATHRGGHGSQRDVLIVYMDNLIIRIMSYKVDRMILTQVLKRQLI